MSTINVSPRISNTVPTYGSSTVETGPVVTNFGGQVAWSSRQGNSQLHDHWQSVGGSGGQGGGPNPFWGRYLQGGPNSGGPSGPQHNLGQYTQMMPETPDQGPSQGPGRSLNLGQFTQMMPETPDQGPSQGPGRSLNLGQFTQMMPETPDQGPAQLNV